MQRFALPAGHAEALLDEESLNYVSPFGRLLVACLRPIDALLDAYRNGGGVPYADYGADLHEGQAAFTRPLFSRLLAQEWLPSVPEIHARLLADPPARVADLACGGGISSIAIARGYPKVRVDGIDLDTASIEAARRHLAGSGVEDRVSFEVRDAADPALAHRYDLVTVFEALHDMSYPVDVLRAARGLLAEGGVVLVGDERTAESFGAPADDLERLYYGFSILHCLPVGMVGEGAAGTGTVMRPATVEAYARDAGFEERRGGCRSRTTSGASTSCGRSRATAASVAGVPEGAGGRLLEIRPARARASTRLRLAPPSVPVSAAMADAASEAQCAVRRPS